MIAGFIVGFVSTLVAYFITFGVKWIVEKPQKPVAPAVVCCVCCETVLVVLECRLRVGLTEYFTSQNSNQPQLCSTTIVHALV